MNFNGNWAGYYESGVIVLALMTDNQKKECDQFQKKYNSIYPGLINPHPFPDPQNTAIVCTTGAIGNFKKSNIVNAFSGFFETEGSLMLTDHSVKITIVDQKQLANNIEYLVTRALCYKPKFEADYNHIRQHFLKMLFLFD